MAVVAGFHRDVIGCELARRRQGGGALRRRVARQEADRVPLLLRHHVTAPRLTGKVTGSGRLLRHHLAGHGHRREDVHDRRRRAQV